MIKRIIQIVSLLCITSINAFGDNVLTIDDAVVGAGSSNATISVKMNNTEEITAIEFDLDLPEGISLESSSDVTLSGRTTAKKHNLMEVSSFDGITRVMIASSKNATFSGNEGEVCTLNLTLDPAKIVNGEYKINIKNLYLSKVDGTIFEPSGYTAKLNIFTLVSSITLDSHNASKILGDSFNLTASVLPENATYKTVTWSSSNESIAKVKDGEVSCLAYGKVTIKVTTTDGSNLSDSCVVFVDNPTYRIVYKVDGEIYHEDSVKYTTKLTAIASPVKEGYTFSGWSEVPATMPAKDVEVNGTFKINKYKLVYMVDGKEYQSSEIEYSSKLTAIAAPEKEGYTFSGWSEIPATMPAKDVEVNGTFKINKYKLVYMVDGKEYQSSEIEYSSKLTVIAAPVKEGYTFSGWSEIPATMPAKDVTVTGTFKVNKYNITYYVDGEVYKTVQCDYDSPITLLENPTKEGYTFSGWSEAPATMPAKDIEVSGKFSKDYEKEDVNQDGKVDSQDVLKVYEFIRDSTTVPTSTTRQDVNKDGKVDSQDVLKVYEYIRDH